MWKHQIAAVAIMAAVATAPVTGAIVGPIVNFALDDGPSEDYSSRLDCGAIINPTDPTHNTCVGEFNWFRPEYTQEAVHDCWGKSTITGYIMGNCKDVFEPHGFTVTCPKGYTAGTVAANTTATPNRDGVCTYPYAEQPHYQIESGPTCSVAPCGVATMYSYLYYMDTPVADPTSLFKMEYTSTGHIDVQVTISNADGVWFSFDEAYYNANQLPDGGMLISMSDLVDPITATPLAPWQNVTLEMKMELLAEAGEFGFTYDYNNDDPDRVPPPCNAYDVRLAPWNAPENGEDDWQWLDECEFDDPSEVHMYP